MYKATKSEVAQLIAEIQALKDVITSLERSMILLLQKIRDSE